MEGLMCITGSKSPVVVVLSGSMEPDFKRGDILFLHMSKDSIRAGDIVVFYIDGCDIPIVHHVIKLFVSRNNNPMDDRVLYNHGQHWLQQHHIMGRAVGFLPFLQVLTLHYLGDNSQIMTEKPILKYILIGALGFLVLILKNRDTILDT